MKHSNATAPALMTPCMLCRLLSSSPSSRQTKLFLPFLAPAILARSVTTTTTTRRLSRVAIKKPGALSPTFAWSKRPHSRSEARRLSSLAAVATAEYSPESTAATMEDTPLSAAQSEPSKSGGPERKDTKYLEYDIGPVHFSKDEQTLARQTIVPHQRNSDAFDRLFPKGTSRRPIYTYPLLFQAIAHVQHQIRTTVDELEYSIDRRDDALETQRVLHNFLREASREKGWAPATTLRHMKRILFYLILEKKALRLARRVWRDYCQKNLTKEERYTSGNLFDILVIESLRVAETPYQLTMAAKQFVDTLSAVEQKRMAISQATIHQLVQNIPITSLIRLCNTLIKNEVFLSEYTTLHVVGCLIEGVASADSQLAIMACSLLETMPKQVRRDEGFVFRCYQVFYAILRFMPDRDDIRERILTLLEPVGGLRNEILYPYIFTCAVKDGNEQTMKEIFDLMANAGMKPTRAMYNSLYWHFKMKGDRERRNAVLRERANADDEAQRPLFDDYLKTDIVHAVALEKISYHKVLRTYRQYFKDDLLYTLRIAGIGRGIESAPLAPSKRDDLRPPNPVVLNIMYLRWLKQARNGDDVWRAYVKYKNMLNDLKVGPLLIKCGSGLPLAFMRAIAQWNNDYAIRVELVSAILQDMLHRKSLVKPHEHHWGMLGVQLEVSGNMARAEKLVQIMMERGLLIPQVTWSSLTRGYVREGNSFMAGDVLRRMIDAGGELSETGTIWIGRVKDRDEFMRGLNGGDARTMEANGEQSNSFLELVTSAGSDRSQNTERPRSEAPLFDDNLISVDDGFTGLGDGDELDTAILDDVETFFNILGLDKDGKVTDERPYARWKRVVDLGISQRIKRKHTQTGPR